MSSFLNNRNRRVIPRWRNFKRTITLGELSSSIKLQTPKYFPTGDFLEEKLFDWQKNQTISFAADVVSSAFVLGQPDRALEVAKFLLAHSHGVSESTLSVAKRILKIIDSGEDNSENERSQNQIQKQKQHLIADPRDAIVWIDLAREYTLLGQVKKAQRCIEYALKLAPANRFVLRTACRFFIHIRESERALKILRTSHITEKDPWILSAEIATASMFNHSTRYAKRGRGMIESNIFSPFDLSELASALGTLEFENGNNRRAKNLFQKALVKPTENSVAQAEWATRELRGFELEPRNLRVPNIYEARSWELFFKSDWGASLQEAMEWYKDEPFSTRPVVHASYILAVVLEDYQNSIDMIENSLIANQHDPTLRNNLAFAYATLNNIKKAEEQFRYINLNEVEVGDLIALTATQGLIEFRRGLIETGRALYRKAIELARKKNEPEMAALGAVFLAREEILAKTNEQQKALEQASRFVKTITRRNDIRQTFEKVEAKRLQANLFG